MKFVIESLSKCSPRLGHLQKNDIILHSPLLLQHTKSAIVPFLSQEVFNYVTTESQAYSICVDSTVHMSEALTQHRNGIASFAGLGSNCISFLTVKNPSEVCKSGFHEKDQLSIYTRTGRKTITADQYMDLAQSHLPDVFHALCDGDTTEISSNKRTIKSADRTKEFFDRCLERFRNSAELKSHSLFVAPIEGGYNIKARENLINELIINNADIDGYFLDGFHNNGTTATSLQVNNMRDIVIRCNELLPADKFKVMLGPYNPVTTMELIALGVDVFDSSYCYLATKYSCALTFSFDLNGNASNEYDMNLSDVRHNTTQYIEFFKCIRQSVADGTLKELIELVRTQFVKRCLLEENIKALKEAELEKEEIQRNDTKLRRSKKTSQSVENVPT